MTVLALDIATVTGWAHDSEAPGIPISGTFRSPSPRGNYADGEGFDFGVTFCGYRQWLSGLIALTKPETVAFEAPLSIVHGASSKVRTNQSTIRVLFGLAAITEELATSLSLSVCEANVQTVKKHFAGRGFASKDEMMARCRQLRWEVKSHDAADACALWCYVKSLHDPKFWVKTLPLFEGAL